MEKKKPAELIKESAQELGLIERNMSKGLVRDRVRFIRLLKEDASLSIAEAAAKAGGYKKSWAYNILNLYEQKAIEGVKEYPCKGTTVRLSAEQQEQLKEALQADSVSTLHQRAVLIKEITGIAYCDSAVWFVFKRLGIKKKTGRPQYVRKDIVGAEAFKKSP